VLGEEPVDDAAEGAAGEAHVVERLAAGVERDDAVGVERGAVPFELVEVGVRHRKRGAVLAGLAVEGHAVALREDLLQAPDAAKPDACHRGPAAVFEAHFEALRLAPVDDAGRLHFADDGHRLAVFGKAADGGDGLPVEVAARVVAQQVAHGAHPRGGGEHLGALFSDAAEVADVFAEEIGGRVQG